MNPRLLIVATLLAAPLLAACGFRAEPTGPTASAWPVVVIDATGGLITVPAAPTTIISADPAATATLRALGLGSSVQEVEPSRLATTPEVATASLVVLRLGDKAPITLPTARIFRWGAPDPRQSGALVAELGLAVGRGATALALARTIDRGVADVYARVAGEPATPVAIQVGPLAFAGTDSPITRLVGTLGATSVFNVQATVTFAEIRRAAPAAWIAMAPPATTLQALRGSDELAGVPAVRDGRFLVLDRATLEPGPDLPAALAALAHVLHPAAA